MPTHEQLKRLFQAFRDHNDAIFHKVAEAIIAEELAANHHHLANDLRRALDQHKEKQGTSNHGQMSILPKDRRNGEQLIALQESLIDQTKVVLSNSTQKRIDRLLDEHRKRNLLARYGYLPKTKLLFWGPPGCGKTFTARYLAYELGLPIGLLQLSSVISSFLGETASHLQSLFDVASSRPMVLLLDEIDAVGKNRDDRNDVGELKRVVNTFLQAMDSFNSKQSIIIAASNHQYLLDSALWRRFDDVIYFPLPGKLEREIYLTKLLSGIDFGGSIPSLAKEIALVSFADIERLIIEAIKTMLLNGKDRLESKDILTEFKAHKSNLEAAHKAKP